jgi:hypothetical protein
MRTDSAKTVLWAPFVETDAKGQAGVDFKLSDSVTRYRAVADAQGAGRIGSAIETIISKPPLQLTPVVPDEVTLGDRIDIPLRITDASSARGEVRVSVEAAEQSLVVEPTEITSKPAGGPRQRQLFSVKATGLSDRAVLVFRGQAGRHVDVVEQTLRIEPTGYAQTVSTSGVLGGEQELTVEIPEDVVPGSIHATLVVFSSIVADLQSGLRSIADDRFESAVAAVAVSDLLVDYLRQNKVADPDSLRLVRECRTGAQQRLRMFRDSEGGYSRLEGEPAEMVATAAALLVLVSDRDAFGGSNEQIDRTVRWLRDQSAPQQDEKATATSASSRAWSLWALAVAGQTDLDSMLELVAASAAESRNTEQLALAALAAARLNRGDLASDLLEDLTKQQEGDGRVGDPVESDGATTALAVMAWLTQPASSAAPASKSAAWLLSQRDGSGFGSPQATALALHALVAWDERERRNVPTGKVVIRKGEDLLAEQEITPNCRGAVVLEGFGDNLSAGKNTFKVGVTKTNQLPYTWAVRYHRRERPAPTGAHVLELHTGLAKPKADEGQTVRLSVGLKNASDQFVPSPVAEIGLPAGLEIAPFLLDAEKKAGRITDYETRPRRIILFFPELPPGDQVDLTFDATAIVPGEFSGPASFAYLPQDPSTRYWAEPLAVAIRATE